MTLEKQIVIQCEDGLHARPAMMFAELAQGFSASVKLTKEKREVDGKSILELLTLAADRGAELLVEVDGEDEEQALQAILRFFAGQDN